MPKRTLKEGVTQRNQLAQNKQRYLASKVIAAGRGNATGSPIKRTIRLLSFHVDRMSTETNVRFPAGVNGYKTGGMRFGSSEFRVTQLLGSRSMDDSKQSMESSTKFGNQQTRADKSDPHDMETSMGIYACTDWDALGENAEPHQITSWSYEESVDTKREYKHGPWRQQGSMFHAWRT
jgi:hypothetical protein